MVQLKRDILIVDQGCEHFERFPGRWNGSPGGERMKKEQPRNALRPRGAPRINLGGGVASAGAV